MIPSKGFAARCALRMPCGLGAAQNILAGVSVFQSKMGGVPLIIES